MNCEHSAAERINSKSVMEKFEEEEEEDCEFKVANAILVKYETLLRAQPTSGWHCSWRNPNRRAPISQESLVRSLLEISSSKFSLSKNLAKFELQGSSNKANSHRLQSNRCCCSRTPRLSFSWLPLLRSLVY